MVGRRDRVAAVVVTYNRKDMLLDCIAHLQKQTIAGLMDIIVIDNNSVDGTGSALEPLVHLGVLHYVNTGKNLGGAGGFNRGIREAVAMGCRYVWMMDDDCLPFPNALEELLIADDVLDGSYGFLCSKVIWKDGSVCNMNVPRHHMYCNVKDFESSFVGVDLASFVSLFIPTNVIQSVGLPICEFFIWTDDWEFTRRISRQTQCYLVNDSVVVHSCNQNMGADIVFAPKDRFGRFRLLYRNDVVLYRREGISGFAYEAARLMVHIIRVLTFSHSSRYLRILTIINGTADGFTFNPPVERI